MSPTYKGTAIIAGIGDGSGTGAATARLLASEGYRVALIARRLADLDTLSASIVASGGVAASFAVRAYDAACIKRAFVDIEAKWGKETKFTLWNAGSANWGPFLEITEAQIQDSVDTNVVGAFIFGQESVKSILASTTEADKTSGHRGTIIFTGATAALRGGNGFSAFAAGKFGIRAISQSMAREFGKEGIHVAHSIIDGAYGSTVFVDERTRLSPDSIAKAYLYLHQQDPSAWTQELDLRPAHEKF